MASTTRQALLQALSAAEGAYISGQQLAQQLGVSRAAVHKAAAALTAQGYALKAVSRRGYRLLGGDPFEPENQRALLPMLRRIREKYPQKTVWCYTGYRLEELMSAGSHPRCEATEEMLSCIDILIDGRFIAEEKDISLQFRGSRNQRIIDMDRSRQAGKIVLWDKLRK